MGRGLKDIKFLSFSWKPEAYLLSFNHKLAFLHEITGQWSEHKFLRATSAAPC